MKKYSLAAIVGGAILLAASASASTNFDFTSGVSGNAETVNGLTVSMTAIEVVGNSGGPTGNFSTNASATFYNTAGMGICQTGSGLPGNDCTSPNHQINNGTDCNLNSGGETGPGGSGCGGTYYYEFMLMQFTSGSNGAMVNLTSQAMTLGNFGTNGVSGDNNPFGANYWTYTGSDTLSQIDAALAATTAGGLGSVNGFTAQTTSCNSGCSVNATGVSDNLTGTNVSYLLFGASVSQPGLDFFKLQGLSVANYTTTTFSSTPEPATFGLIGLALAGLGVYGRKRKSRS